MRDDNKVPGPGNEPDPKKKPAGIPDLEQQSIDDAPPDIVIEN